MPSPDPQRHALRALASANFVVGSMSYGVVGALPVLACSWRISPGQAAWLVAACSLAYALGAPLVQMTLGHLPRRRLLLGGLALHALATLAGAFAGGLDSLLASRVLAGLAAGAVSPLAQAIGAQLAPEPRRGQAIAVVFFGVTLASVASAPLSAALAPLLGWRGVLAMLTLVALASLAWIALAVPAAGRGQRMHPRQLAGLLLRPTTAAALAVTVLQTAAFFATYTLLQPLAGAHFGASPAQAGLALLVLGATGVAGNLVAQRASLRYGADILLRWTVPGLLVVFAGLAALVAAPSAGLGQRLPALALLVAWALLQDLFYPAQLRRLVELEPAAAGMVIALNSSSIFIGISLGAWLGGTVADHLGLGGLPALSGLLTLLALAALCRSRRAGAPRQASTGADAGPPLG